MNEKTTVLLKAKEIIKPTALAHVPQDSDVEAVTDQWLHAIATDSEFYCNPELTGFEELKRRVIRQLEQNGLYTTRSVFFDDVFGFLRLKPTFDAKFRFIDLFAGIGGVRLGVSTKWWNLRFFLRVRQACSADLSREPWRDTVWRHYADTCH